MSLLVLGLGLGLGLGLLGLRLGLADIYRLSTKAKIKRIDDRGRITNATGIDKDPKRFQGPASRDR